MFQSQYHRGYSAYTNAEIFNHSKSDDWKRGYIKARNDHTYAIRPFV